MLPIREDHPSGRPCVGPIKADLTRQNGECVRTFGLSSCSFGSGWHSGYMQGASPDRSSYCFSWISTLRAQTTVILCLAELPAGGELVGNFDDLDGDEEGVERLFGLRVGSIVGCAVWWVYQLALRTCGQVTAQLLQERRAPAQHPVPLEQLLDHFLGDVVEQLL